jgi:hypothetical protein
VNHLYNIPFFKQQINISANMKNANLSAEAREILGFSFQEAATLEHYFAARTNKKY